MDSQAGMMKGASLVSRGLWMDVFYFLHGLPDVTSATSILKNQENSLRLQVVAATMVAVILHSSP